MEPERNTSIRSAKKFLSNFGSVLSGISEALQVYERVKTCGGGLGEHESMD